MNLQNFSAFDAKTRRQYTDRVVQNDAITSYRAEKALKGARDIQESLSDIRSMNNKYKDQLRSHFKVLDELGEVSSDSSKN